MSYTKGIVQYVKVEVKTSQRTGKEYGSASLKVDDVWYGGFAKKTDTGYKLLDKNKNEVTQGMEIEMMYETNDKGYHSFDGKTLMALSTQSQPAQAANTPQPTQQTTQQEKVSEIDLKRLMEGVLLNRAGIMALIAFHGKEMPADIEEKLARKAKQYLNELNND